MCSISLKVSICGGNYSIEFFCLLNQKLTDINSLTANFIKMVHTRSMTAAKPVQVVKSPKVARAPYELRSRSKPMYTMIISIPQTPYNLRPRIQMV
jgi:hypothetical protein